jgi:hypothetical protein
MCVIMLAGSLFSLRLESEARETRKGLWVDPHPVPPWERWELGNVPRFQCDHHSTRQRR